MIYRSKSIGSLKKKSAIAMLRICLHTVCCALAFSCITARAQQPSTRPNILIIMADDMGYSDLGCFGSEISTPNLDKLADQGMRLTQFYNAARCCPTRASLLTGLYPHQAGVGDMVENLGTPAYQGYLNSRCITIAEALKGAGYATLMSGKWHVGAAPGRQPLDRGFDRYFGLLDGASNYYQPLNPYRAIHTRNSLKVLLDREDYKPEHDFFMTDAISNYAAQFIQETPAEQPIFLYLAYTAPHWPLHAPREDIDRYRGLYKGGWDSVRQIRFSRQLQLGVLPKGIKLSPRFESPDTTQTPSWSNLSETQKELWDLRMATYAAMIERMDQGIGKVMEILRLSGRLENTIIMFMSDNGGCHEEVFAWPSIVHDRTGPIGSVSSFDSYGYPWANVSNTPFRLFKSFTTEGGFSSPFIAWFPGKIKAGTIRHETAHVMDIMHTCLELAGLSYPQTYKGNTLEKSEGLSMWPLLTGKKWKGHSYLCWEHENSRAIWMGDWKLVQQRNEKYWQLFNLKTDRSELIPMQDQYPQRVKTMQSQYQEWANRISVAEDIKQLRKTSSSMQQ